MSPRDTILAGLLACALPVASAGPSEAASSAAGKASSVAAKVEGSVKRGVEKAASAVEHSAKVTGHAVANTAKKIGLPTQSASGVTSPKAP
jgi:hypothetical protein